MRTGKIGGRAVSKPRAQRRAGSMAGWDIFMSPVVCVCRVATVDGEPDEPVRVGERSRTEAGMDLSRHRRTRYCMRPACTTPKMMLWAIRGSMRNGSRSPQLIAFLRIPDCCSGTEHRPCLTTPYGRVLPLENAESMISRRTGFGVAGSPSVGKVIPQIWVITVLKRIELPFSGFSATPHASGRG